MTPVQAVNLRSFGSASDRFSYLALAKTSLHRVFCARFADSAAE